MTCCEPVRARFLRLSALGVKAVVIGDKTFLDMFGNLVKFSPRDSNPFTQIDYCGIRVYVVPEHEMPQALDDGILVLPNEIAAMCK